MHYRFSTRQEHDLDTFLLQSAQLVFGEEQVAQSRKIRDTLRNYKLRILNLQTNSFTIDVNHVQMFIVVTVCDTTVVLNITKRCASISTPINTKVFYLERTHFFGYFIFDPVAYNMAQSLVNIHDDTCQHIVRFALGAHTSEYTFEQYLKDMYQSLITRQPRITRILGDNDTVIEITVKISSCNLVYTQCRVHIENKKDGKDMTIHSSPLFETLKDLLFSNNNNIPYEQFYVIK